jgi:hypothetical protein
MQTYWCLNPMLTLDTSQPRTSFPTTDKILSSSGQKNTRENIDSTAFICQVSI